MKNQVSQAPVVEKSDIRPIGFLVVAGLAIAATFDLSPSRPSHTTISGTPTIVKVGNTSGERKSRAAKTKKILNVRDSHSFKGTLENIGNSAANAISGSGNDKSRKE